MYVLGLRRLCDNAFERGGFDQFGFAGVPCCEELGARGAAQDAWVNESRETDVGEVPGGAEYAFEILGVGG